MEEYTNDEIKNIYDVVNTFDSCSSYLAVPCFDLSQRLYNKNIFKLGLDALDDKDLTISQGISKVINMLSPLEARHLMTEITKYIPESKLSQKIKMNYHQNFMDMLSKSTKLKEFMSYFYKHRGNSFGGKQEIESIKDMFNSLICEICFDDTLNNYNLLIEENAVFLHSLKKDNNLSREDAQALKIVENFGDVLNDTKIKNMSDFRRVFQQVYERRKQIQEAFYDARACARSYSARRYNENCGDINKLPSDIIEGVKVFDARESDFRFFITCIRSRFKYNGHEPKKDIAQKIKYDYDHNYNGDCFSMSYVSTKHMKTFNDLREWIAFGFNKMDVDRIVNISEKDNYSCFSLGSDSISNIQEFFGSPEEMLDKCERNNTYNEINVLNIKSSDNKALQKELDNAYGKDFYKKFSGLYPAFIYCLDGPSQIHMELAKLMNVPIVVGDGKNYEFNGSTFESGPCFDKI